MSKLLITMILSFCPGREFDSNGQAVTTSCQERMMNCMVNKVGTGEPTKEEFYQCRSELISKYGSSDKVSASSLEE